MPSQSELEAQRDTLRRAIRSGVLVVTHGEKSVKYRSMADLQAALSDVQNELGEITGARRRRVRYLSVRKGIT
jgi:hypothetical protein